jgi:anti-sigma-K factor RskA
MIDERQQKLAALYALDLLGGAENTAFETELKSNAELQQLVRELRDSSAAFALTTPQVAPSPELKARIMAKINGSASRTAFAPGKLLFFRPAAIIPWAIAAGFAIGCAWLGQLHLHNRAENSVLQDQLRLAEIELTSARHQLEAERILTNRQIADATEQLTQLREQLRMDGDPAQFKIATLAAVPGNSPQDLAIAVWNPTTQQGVLRVEKLPALASDKDYQLWLIDPAYPTPVDGGVFTVDPATGHAQINFKPNQRVNNAAKFAISLERKGGVPKPEGAIMLLGD